MSVGLLDANVLIALAWPVHIHHGAAHAWLASNQAAGWATCPITQSAFVRFSSNRGLTEYAVNVREALMLLGEIVAWEGHEFWADSISLTDERIPTGLLAGYRQVTDAYLLGLAIHRGGKLVTFDRRVTSLFQKGMTQADCLEVIGSD